MSKGQEWLPRAYLAFVLIITLFALVVVPLADIGGGFPRGQGTLVFFVLLALGLSQVLLARLVLLPPMIANPEVSEEQVALFAYPVAYAPVLLGLVISTLTGQGLLVLPFSAIALSVFFIYRSYLAENKEQPRR